MPDKFDAEIFSQVSSMYLMKGDAELEEDRQLAHELIHNTAYLKAIGHQMHNTLEAAERGEAIHAIGAGLAAVFHMAFSIGRIYERELAKKKTVN
jgi:hypothetical protein